ncbi:MAG: hypothetical protein ARM1_0126 [Candidatus Micrarchaeota archaeon]|nr:MAG: hypothetical protein ARM1_0126 [Candidatus Micrarchaeota archaeon]
MIDLSNLRLQASLELLITLSFGLVILIPIIGFALVQVANANYNLEALEAQQAAQAIANTATLVYQEGYPAKSVVEIYVPPGVENIYVGSTNGNYGHFIIFQLYSILGPDYVSAYTTANITGYLGNIVQQGSYLVSIEANSSCSFTQNKLCVVISSS